MIPLTIMKELPSLANRRLRARGRPGEASPRAARESRRILWFVDNTVAMHSFIKGRASHAALDRAISMAKFLQAGHESGWRRASAPPLTQGHARVGIWMEFVDSGGNWSDGISRELGEDVFAREQGFHTASMEASQRVARKRRGARSHRHKVPPELWSWTTAEAWHAARTMAAPPGESAPCSPTPVASELGSP